MTDKLIAAMGAYAELWTAYENIRTHGLKEVWQIKGDHPLIYEDELEGVIQEYRGILDGILRMTKHLNGFILKELNKHKAICEECGKEYASRQTGQKYHSKKCATRANVRAFRERKKETEGS